MQEKISRKDFSINTIIGPNTNVNGDVSSDGFTRVDGNMHGDVNALGYVVVGERARMKSNITGTSITIGGVVQGNVLASERLIVLSTGLLIGDVIARSVQADEGCIIHGRIIICADESEWKSTVAEYEDAQRVRKTLSGGGD